MTTIITGSRLRAKSTTGHYSSVHSGSSQPGQISSSSRLSALGGAGLIEEAIGIRASGTVQGKPLITAYLVVAESTMEVFPRFVYLPLVSNARGSGEQLTS